MAATNGSKGHGAADTATSPASEGRAAPADREGAPRASRPRTPVNFLRATRARERRAEAPSTAGAKAEGRVPKNTPAPSATPPKPAQADAGTDAWIIPDSVRDRFTRDGRRLYFPDGRLAIRDYGDRLTTPSEEALVVRSLVDIARARGMTHITVGGSATFRQKGWREAKIAGLEVHGYRPRAGERAAMIRLLATRREAPADTPRAASAAEARRQPPPAERAARKEEEPLRGTLLDHGREHYQFDPKRDMSYYVRLKTPEGRKVIWGTDFERALREALSQPRIGDEVVLQRRGSEAVKVTRREFDEAGKVVNETPLSTHRTAWRIERPDFLEARAKAADALRTHTPEQALTVYPGLEGPVRALHAADLVSRRFANPKDRERFVAIVRETLARQVSSGEPLPTVPMREHPAKRSPPAQTRAPTR